MRDKDAQLIFESYRKRVLLNEAVPLAVPVAAGVGIGLLEILGLAAAGIGATALASEMSKKSDQIQGLFKPTPSSQAAAEKIASIIQTKDYSIRGLYGALNFAKSLKVEALSETVKMSETSLKMLQSLESGSLDQTQAADYIKSILVSFKEQCSALLVIAKKTNMGELIKIVETISKHQMSQIDKLMEMVESKGGGSGKEPDKEPDKGPKTDWWKTIKDIVKFMLTLKFWILVLISIISIALLYGRVMGAKELGSAVAGGGMGAVEATGDFFEGMGEEIKRKTPQSTYSPETRVGSTPSANQPTAQPAATPFDGF